MQQHMTVEEYRARTGIKPMTAADYRASNRGRANRAQGLAFENIISTACEHYTYHGMAFIEKTPEPMKVLGVIDRQRNIFKAAFEKQAQPDYKGTMKGGRAVAFEAKFTSTDRIQQDAVSEEQWKALNHHEAMGAWCFVLVCLGLKYYRVPWEKWKTMQQDCGHKYMNAEDLTPYLLGSYPAQLRFLATITPSNTPI